MGQSGASVARFWQRCKTGANGKTRETATHSQTAKTMENGRMTMNLATHIGVIVLSYTDGIDTSYARWPEDYRCDPWKWEKYICKRPTHSQTAACTGSTCKGD